MRKVPWKVCTEGSAEGFGFSLPLNLSFDKGRFCGRSCGRFPRKVPRKVVRKTAVSSHGNYFYEQGLIRDIPEGSRKVGGRLLQKVLRKITAEGSAEGYCGTFRRRLLQKVLRKVIAEGSAEGSAEGFPRKVQK